MALLCVLNAVRRTSDKIAAGWGIAWLPDAALSFTSGLVVAIVVALAVVATYNLIPHPSRRRTAALGIAALVSSAIATLLLFAIDSGGTFDFDAFGGFGWTFVGTWPRYALLALLLTAVFVHVRAADGSEAATRGAELDRAHFAQQIEEAHLQVLQAQIEPHFLFNTLANVRRLYTTDRSAGESMLGDLIVYLKVALPQIRAADSTLGQEAALTESYLGIQRFRMGRRLTFDVSVPEPLRAARVPPMMLLTLAENAIKHGLTPLPEGGHVRVTADVAAGLLRIQVADSGAGFAGTSGGGTGLANIRARLASQYGSAADLRIELNHPCGIIAVIALPYSVVESVERAA